MAMKGEFKIKYLTAGDSFFQPRTISFGNGVLKWKFIGRETLALERLKYRIEWKERPDIRANNYTGGRISMGMEIENAESEVRKINDFNMGSMINLCRRINCINPGLKSMAIMPAMYSFGTKRDEALMTAVEFMSNDADFREDLFEMFISWNKTRSHDAQLRILSELSEKLKTRKKIHEMQEVIQDE